jgi:hypothetical protein
MLLSRSYIFLFVYFHPRINILVCVFLVSELHTFRFSILFIYFFFRFYFHFLAALFLIYINIFLMGTSTIASLRFGFFFPLIIFIVLHLFNLNKYFFFVLFFSSASRDGNTRDALISVLLVVRSKE